MENFQNEIELLASKAAVLESQVARIRRAIKCLEEGDSEQTPAVTESAPVQIKAQHLQAPVNTTEQDDEAIRKRFDGYPIEGKNRDKIRFILGRYNRAISEPEFERVIKVMEDADSNMLEVWERTLRGLKHPKFGEILEFHFEGLKKLKFHALPTWRTEDKLLLLSDKMPIPNELNRLDPKYLINPRIVFKRVEWTA